MDFLRLFGEFFCNLFFSPRKVRIEGSLILAYRPEEVDELPLQKLWAGSQNSQ